MTVAIAAIALFSTTAFAQAPQQSNGQKASSECCKGKENKADRPCMQMLLFDGIQLTDAQKDQLKAIETPAKAKADRNRKAKEERATADKQDKANYLKSVKTVLTPEQYVKFLENAFVNAHGHKAKGKMDRKDNKGGDRSKDGKQRPNGPQRPTKAPQSK